MQLKSINPATEAEIASFEELSSDETEQKLGKSELAYREWKSKSYKYRAEFLLKAAKILKKDKKKYGKLATLEMGKPITQAVAEVEKCAWVCEYYANETVNLLSHEKVKTDASESYIQFDPLGIILAIMPWNFPFWQVFRAVAPAIMAGNTMILKHASNVPQCGIAIEEIFQKAGLPEGVFQNLIINSSKVRSIIEDPRIKAATLTGSEYAGSKVAEQCGNQIKKTVLELGGSDPFIVLEDADMDFTCDSAVMARFQNNGQSCVAAKRFIVMENIYEEFCEKYKINLETKKFGDPMDPLTIIGPLATKSIYEDIKKQVSKSIELGAKIISGGHASEGKGYFFEPTLLGGITKEMPVYTEETFGPVSAIISVKSEEEAIKIANDTEFGLGASIWTKDIEKTKSLAGQINAGCVFINSMVKSDPRLPFGGIKKSGYGRELSHYGIKEFVNIKTVYVK